MSESVPLSGLPRAKRIAFFLGSLPGGGAERIVLDLARAMTYRGQQVDLVLSRLRGELVSTIPSSVRTIELGSSGRIEFMRTLFRLPSETWRTLIPLMVRKPLKKIRSLPYLERYLLIERPDILMASTNIPNILAVWASHLARSQTSIILKQDNSVVQAARNTTDSLQLKLPNLVRRWYGSSHAIVAVSKGVAQELYQLTSVPYQRVHVIYNPIDFDRISALAGMKLDHPWFQPGQPPVLLAAGRLHEQKDYPTLLRAFKLIRAHRTVRLAILGEGRERARLEEMIRDLEIGEDVGLLGFQANPFAYMAKSAVFVLSSAWEGLANVLIEALASGCRVVSTDCRHGPAEILDNGRYGKLVPVGSPEALAGAIGTALEQSPEPEKAKKRASAFGIKGISKKYLQLFSETQARFLAGQ
jgi:glycosyltransferase involved in cell wall biosynthesis